MQKIYFLIQAITFVIITPQASTAQCSNGRYHNFVFTNHQLTSDITYGSNIKSNNTTQTLKLDVYQPQGDVETSRPLIIIAHGGSFVGGSKTGGDVTSLCKDFAKMGYVVASMGYRLGMTRFPFPGPDSVDAGPALIRGMHDGKAAVRFFRKNARIGGNTYKIDTNNIYFAGVSAGGFIGLHMAYLDKQSEFPTYIDTIAQKGLGGGIEGLSGNPGYPSDFKALVNLCGALGDSAWIDAGDKPVLNMHGNQDKTVPYGSALIKLINTYPILQVDGSYSVAARANQMGLTNCFKTYWGQDHVPHSGGGVQYDTTLVISRNFLEHFVCGVPLNCNYTSPVVLQVGVDELINTSQIVVYPNPANYRATIDLSAFKARPVSIELMDALGRRVNYVSSITSSNYQLTKGNLSSGIYFINISDGNNVYRTKIIFE